MKQNVNILFLGGAKRVSMAEMFKAAARERGLEAEIFSYEMSPYVPIASVAKVIIGLKWSDPEVVSHLLDVVRANDIDIVVPFVDGAVSIAARLSLQAADEQIKLFVPVSDADIAEQMFDKVVAAKIFEDHNIDIPRTYREGDPCLRLIAKPRHGSASKGIECINSLEALERVLTHADQYLIQERIDNRIEYTVDCYVSMANGQAVAIVPRQRLEVSGGEVTSTVTVEAPELVALARRTIEAVGLRGAVTVQIIRDLDYCTDTNPQGKVMVMEVNPRLGGGAVCAVHAGANIPAMIIDESLGIDVAPTEYTAGIMIARYTKEVTFNTNIYK